ncbi:MAG: 2-phosphosulfolactate phosphatase [Xanthomonadaceae bacterium]|nr:2-phosphosulfolactate phosphatase [Xanthomonadaceae bacterium]
MQNVHVILRKEDLEPARLQGRVVVVFDVMFATTTIATVLAHGAAAVIPARDADEARRAAAGLAEGEYLLAGESRLHAIPGFLPAVPLRLLREPLAGRQLVYSTTNGTVALLESEPAAAVYAGALVNGRAVAERLASRHGEETVLLVCAGSGGGFNVEDFVGAGHVIHHLTSSEPDRWALTDAALAARELYRAHAGQLARLLLQCRLGRLMQAAGQLAELEHAARLDVYDCVPALQERRLVAAVDSEERLYTV